MYDQIKKHIVDLSIKLGSPVTYTFVYVSVPDPSHLLTREEHKLTASGYIPIRRLKSKHILNIRPADFVAQAELASDY